MNEKIALIISTHDKSDDLWAPLESTYLNYWNDINMPIYLTTNHKNFNGKLFKSLQIGNEISWSDNIIKSLNSIQEEYVLLTFDDLFLVSKVDNTFINELLKRAVKENFNYFQLYRSISLGKRIDNTIFKKSKKTAYRNSTIWSFWKKNILLNLLQKNENAWEFERYGNIRSYKYQDFYSTRFNAIPFVNGVIKGLWNPMAIKKLEKLNIVLHKNRRKLSFFNAMRHKIRDLQFDFLTYLIHKIF